MPSSVFFENLFDASPSSRNCRYKERERRKSEHGPYPYDTIFKKKRNRKINNKTNCDTHHKVYISG